MYTVGFFAVFVGLDLDNWDDSCAWYWDTWFLIVTTALLQAGYALTRFRGVARTILTILPTALTVGFGWWYNSIV
jgi:hypothetical protein